MFIHLLKRFAYLLPLCGLTFLLTSNVMASDSNINNGLKYGAEFEVTDNLSIDDFKIISRIVNFDYIKSNPSYEYVETIEFELSEDNPIQYYSKANDGYGYAFSFTNLSDYVLFYHTVHGIDEKVESCTSGGAFGGESAVILPLLPNQKYEFSYSTGFQDSLDRVNSDGTLIEDPSSVFPKHEEPVKELNGTLDVYKIVTPLSE